MGMNAIEFEGVDLGVGDFSLLNEITMENFVENLKKRFGDSFRFFDEISLFVF